MINIIYTQNFDKIRKSDSLEVCDVTYTRVRENWIHRERFITTDEMLFLTNGELFLRVNGADYTLHKGCFFFIHRFSTIVGTKKSDSPCEFYTVAYNGIVSDLSVMELNEIYLRGSSIFVDELLKRLYGTARDNLADANECNILFLLLTYEAKRCFSRVKESVPLMEQAIRYIDSNTDTLITVDSVCDHLGYNRDYISRQFLECYGITIKKYIDQKKLSAAKHLLISSKMSLEQVAVAIGFDDAQHFYKFFRYHENISPSQFRKINT